MPRRPCVSPHVTVHPITPTKPRTTRPPRSSRGYDAQEILSWSPEHVTSGSSGRPVQNAVIVAQDLHPLEVIEKRAADGPRFAVGQPELLGRRFHDPAQRSVVDVTDA